ncbi:hypothetical protein ES319_D08G144800v1 [Gossypium barbadense]|uniref:Uncharacterized protein n=1 Tax=Gossypium barbadense TaxID=3634 RepID=A0A5J5QFF0_GOSBA|nr:hypothetical protein ES319_D08G144800v1 [Gossypium barbadense]
MTHPSNGPKHKTDIERSRLIHVSIQKSITEKILEASLCFSNINRKLRNTTLLACFSFFIAAAEPDTLPDNHKNIKIYMRGGTASLLPSIYKFKQICPLAGSWGTVATSIPRKSDNNGSKETGSVKTWSRRDADDN